MLQSRPRSIQVAFILVTDISTDLLYGKAMDPDILSYCSSGPDIHMAFGCNMDLEYHSRPELWRFPVLNVLLSWIITWDDRLEANIINKNTSIKFIQIQTRKEIFKTQLAN